MINNNDNATGKNVSSRKNAIRALRRDAAFIWNAVIVVVFVCFASLAVASTLLDVLPIRH